jgi:hypothetical protein
MLNSIDEIKAVELSTKPPINGVDSADLLSVDSTTPIVTDVDEINEEEKPKPGDTDTSADEGKPKADDKKKPDEKPAPENKPETKGAVQKRIDELTKKRRTAERERDFEKAQREKERKEFQEEIKKLKAAVPVADKPKKEDFEDEAAYLETLTDWKVDQKVKALREDAAKEASKTEEKTNADEAYAGLDATMEQGREKYKDFDQLVLDKELKLTPEMTDIILDSEIAADIFYYFGSNPDESAEVAKLSPLKAARKIAAIEAELTKEIPKENESSEGSEEENEEEPPPAKPKPKLSNTPPPIKPLKSNGATEKDPSKMTIAEYRTWRATQK